jgi:hypothetical protein
VKTTLGLIGLCAVAFLVGLALYMTFDVWGLALGCVFAFFAGVGYVTFVEDSA